MPKIDRIDPNLLASNPRATLASWERYRPVAVAAFRQHPKTFVYKPVSLKPATVCSRLRDACRGAIAFGYDLSGPLDGPIAVEDFLQWYSEIIVRYDKDHVFIGPLANVLSTITGDSNEQSPDGFSFPILSFEEVSAFTLLLSAGHLTGPVTILSPPDISLLTPRTNVEMISRPDGSLILL